MAQRTVPFVKGHGAGNDFVIVPDPEAALSISPQHAARVCDRRTGIGADGLIRVARTAAMGDRPDSGAEHLRRPGETAPDGVPEWFMDYRNADGSIASMCGNGARVLGSYLLGEGLVEGPEFSIMTRSGPRRVVATEGAEDLAVEMGRPVEGPPGAEPVVIVDDRRWDATAWWMPNPHAVAWVGDLREAGALTSPPSVESQRFPGGTNVEFAVDETGSVGHAGSGQHLMARMRVFERGVGETPSCGTGACAVALALRSRRGAVGAGSVAVETAGGELRVRVDESGTVWLAGPAVIVASGEFLSGWWNASDA